MQRKEYVNAPIVDEFISYMVRLVKGEQPLVHSYTIRGAGRGKNAAWARFNGNKEWSCKTLQHAMQKYYWGGGNNATFSTSLGLLEGLSARLKNASDDKELLCICMKILEWGGVRNGAHGLVSLYCNNNLKGSIDNALEGMDDEEINFAHFRGSGRDENLCEWRMNATFTKIYALRAGYHFAIYDSRVAAGLAYIVRKFYEDCSEGLLADELRFCPLEGRGDAVRDLSHTNYEFRRKTGVGSRRETITERLHAESNVKFNWVIQEVIKKVENDWNWRDEREGSIQRKHAVRAIEAALFMVGYDLKNYFK